MEVKLPSFECLRCGHKWHPRNEEVPTCCAFCKSSYWQKAPKKPSKAFEHHQTECLTCKKVPVSG